MRIAIGKLAADIDSLEAHLAVVANGATRLAPETLDWLQSMRAVIERMRIDLAEMRIKAGLSDGEA